MNHKELGRTGVEIPEIGLGMWQYNGGVEVLRKGLEAGALFIDTAELYKNEDVAGQAIKGMRERVFVATKTHHWKYNDVLRCAEASLRRLGLDTIDLYQLHWPNAAVPIAETMSAMEELVRQGKVRFIGVSNFTVSEFKEAQSALSKCKIAANQVRYSLVDRTMERDLLPFCRENNVTVIAYSPLANRFQKLIDADQANVLEKVARMTNRSKAQVALNWCVSKPGVVAIPKTESIQHVVENCQASGWRLTDEQMALLDEGVRFRRRSRLEVELRRLLRRTMQKIRRG
jgi:diketogulonate reductase-like aldo/keto reductase